jgi:ATP diphosphatase
MAVLRSPRGCPWDLKQTHATLRPFLIEETYEVVDAIDRGDITALRGELGDVLLQCVFHAQLAAEAGRFTAADVADAIADKLIQRHPHVFRPDGRMLSLHARARAATDTPGAVKEQWARIKAQEQASAGRTPRVLAGVPRALPALVRADKIGSRVASVGFDWPDATAVLGKVDEELQELREALNEGPARAAEELGDLLFALASLARKLQLDAEAALSAANDKFTRRFDAIEALLGRAGRDVHGTSLDDLEAAWAAVKRAEAAAARPTSTRARPRSTPAPRARRSRP